MIELIQLAKHINIELQIMSEQMLHLHEDMSFPHLEIKKIACSPKSFEEALKMKSHCFVLLGMA
jgi:hypothetical protein